jgi:hypothetical protein
MIFTVLETTCYPLSNTTNNTSHNEHVMLHNNDKCEICDISQITKYITKHVHRGARQGTLRLVDIQNMTETCSVLY